MTPAELLAQKIKAARSLEAAAYWLEFMLSDECEVLPNGSVIIYGRRHLVARVCGLQIEIHSREHPPPHFHVAGGGINASFSIADGSLVAGELSEKQRRVVMAWYKEGRSQLVSTWNATRPSSCPVGPINETGA
jgi:hypothetical protein